MAKKKASPWTPEQRRASAQKWNEYCSNLRRAFQSTQQEAIGKWLDWEAETELTKEKIEAVVPQELSEERKSSGMNILADVIGKAKNFVEKGEDAIRCLLPIVPRTSPSEAFASATPVTSSVRDLEINTEDLNVLGIKPHILIALKNQKGLQLKFMLERLADPKRPARNLQPQRGIIEINLIRPTPKEPIRVRLGSLSPKTFKDFSDWLELPDYESGEEHQWKAEVLIRPNTTWEKG